MAERPVAAVLGLDLTGGSLALALKQSGRYEAVVGWDASFDVARDAQKHAVADRFVKSPQEAARMAAVALVAVKPAELQDTLTSMAPHLRPGAVVCVLAESLESSGELAARILPASVSLVGGHLVPWEVADNQAAPDAARLRQGVFCLAPATSAHPDAVAFLADLASGLQMEPYFVSAREHDAFFAGISRLPAVMAAALLRVLSREPGWREMSRMAGADLRATTAPADADAERSQQALAAGRDHVVRWLDTLISELSDLRRALADGREPADFFESAAVARQRWLRDRKLPTAAVEQLIPEAPPAKRRFWF